MRKLLFGLGVCLFLGASVLVGCGRRSEPGYSVPTGKDMNTKFTMSGPALATSIPQGEGQDINITLTRGKDFDQDLNLKVESQPKDIDVRLAATTVKPSDKGEVKLTVAVSKGAQPGQHEVVVEAAPQEGFATTLKVPINVKQAVPPSKSRLALTGPPLPLTIKQGDSQSATLILNRSKDMNEMVKLEIEKAPPGIHTTLGSTTLKSSDNKEINVTIAVDQDAPAGNHALVVRATAEKGLASSWTLGINVKEP